jgi:putative ABC transport system permease protein
MRDLRRFVREQLAPLALPPEREQKIVDEWAAQLDEVYEELCADGRSPEDAWRALEGQLPDWQALGHDLEPLPKPRRADVQRPLRWPLRQWATALGVAREALTRGAFADLRAALRLSGKNRTFTAAVVFTLAVCLGANAAIFAVVDAVLLKPLPVPAPDRIVGLGDVYPTVTPNDILANDVPSYFDRLVSLTTLEAQGMFAFWFDTFTVDGTPQELRGVRATPSVFRVLGVPPALGRTFTDAEGEVGAELKIVLSHSLWQQLFGGDPGVIGKSVRLAWTGQQYTVVGVMPREFSFFDRGFPGHAGESRTVQFWLPLAFTPEQRSDAARTRYGFFHLGRLRADATLEQLQAELDALTTANVARYPQFRFAELGVYSLATPLQDAFTRRIRQPLYILWAGAAFVLLIGIFNLINLTLARANARRRELATRLALGASRVKLGRQLVTEGLIPACLGGLGGLIVGEAILRGLALSGINELPNASGIELNAETVFIITSVSWMVGGLLGLVPMLTTARGSVNQVLAENSRSGTGGRGTRFFRRTMVVTQVALSVVLLFAATLLVASFRHLVSLDAGFVPSGVVTATIFPPPSRYPNAQALAQLQDDVLEQLRTAPGVQAVGMTSNIALSGYESPSTVSTAEQPASDEPTIVPSVIAVTPGYFEAMSTPVVRGRNFLDSDRAHTLRVAIVDEQLANRLWPATDPIGKRIYRGDSGPFTIVGVVRNVKLAGLVGAASIGTAYFPHTQAPSLGRLRWIAIKSSVDRAAIMRTLRAKLLEIDRDLPLADIQTMDERTARTLVSERLATNLASMFAAVALALSVVGIYAVLASVVARRTREIGIRMALGSTVSRVFRMVLSEGVGLIVAGVVVGVAGALATARALDGFVFGVVATDARVLATVAIITSAAALAACLAPARRAARINPVDVLSDP